MPEITEAPEAKPSPVFILDPHANRTKEDDLDLSHTVGRLPSWQNLKDSVGTRHGWFGDYDYGFLCMPTLPGFTTTRVPPFFGLKDTLPLLLATIMGFQHALAMIAGIVTPAIIMSGSGINGLNFTAENRSQMISTSLIASGLLSLVQITRFRLAKTRYYLGTGLLSVVGTSFIYLPVLQSSVANMYASGICKSSFDASGVQIFEPCPDAWGAFLGTCMVCSLFPILLSFVPPRVLKKVFPPIVTGVTVMLIGVNLVTSGMQQWGGGSGPCASMPTSGPFVDCPIVGAPNAAPWGDARWIGLGFLVFFSIMVIEFFGSPFMKNAQVVIGLVIGMIVAVACGYTTSDSIKAAPSATFLWTTTYKLSIYPPAIIPLLISYVLAMVESIGDITASCEVSKLSVEGREFESRLQGGIFADGIGGLLAPLMMNSPMSCYAQNNGIISLTRCANTMAGYMCCLFLILMGIFSKFGAIFLTLPDPVLGGMTTFLFASVVVSGIRILSFLPWTRRERFIVAASLSLGLGTALVPGVLTHMINYQGNSSAVQSLVSSVNIILDTGFALGAIVSCLLNGLLPSNPPTSAELADKDINEMQVETQSIHKGTLEMKNLGDYRSIVLTFVILGIESCFRLVAYLMPAVLLDALKITIEKIFPWVMTNHMSAKAPPLENAANVQAMLRFWNYPVEEHLVRTQDNYMLGIHRIPHGRENASTKGEPNPPADIVELLREIGVPLASETKEAYFAANGGNKGGGREKFEANIDGKTRRNPKDEYIKPVVLLYHGFMMCSEVWLCNLDEERNLAFVLAEAGYDVWLGNSRGNKYSLKHMFLKPHEKKFWEFSMDELALFDLPDTVDYILARTGAPSLVYIGFSQGTAQAFASLSINPELNKKVSLFIALAPATTPPGLDNGIVNAVVKAAPNVIYLLLGRKAPLKAALFWQNIMHPTAYATVIDTAVKFLFGWNGRSMSRVQKAVSYQHLYSFTSVRILVHWFQIIRTQVFQMYDDVTPGVPYLSSSRNFLWAECLHKYVYPHIMELLEAHSFNGHVANKHAEGKNLKQLASNGGGRFQSRENCFSEREQEGSDGYMDNEDLVHIESPLKTPKDSPIIERRAFSSQIAQDSTRRRYADGQEH
ncbi:hypothetical protein BGX26_002747 [Mortierella sp. AD094]|nr:hypothetical protein BGX26_002747 [Mortierella sp. AD094]